jgi:glycosyltransferase involved in cell wall biosynthesis
MTYDPKEVKTELGIPADALVVGTVSRLDPVKGNSFFVKAIKEIRDKDRDVLNNVKFLFVGDGSEAHELGRLVHESQLDDHVIFAGARKDVVRMYAAIDIFVLASVMEGMGRVLLEAMVQSKPIVATRVGGIPDIVIGGITGILVPPRNPVELAEAIMSLIQNPEMVSHMGAEGKKTNVP